MVGTKNSKEVLNNTLKLAHKLLTDNGINDWFIAYGTLLGIIRDNSCIDNDDDVDIICNKVHYDLIKGLVLKHGLEIEKAIDPQEKVNKMIKTKKHHVPKDEMANKIIKTKPTSDYGSIDFYMATVNDVGDYYDEWERVSWTKCLSNENKLMTYTWNDIVLNIPNNYEQKLIGRYGDTWKVPQDSKGVRPVKHIL